MPDRHSAVDANHLDVKRPRQTIFATDLLPRLAFSSVHNNTLAPPSVSSDNLASMRLQHPSEDAYCSSISARAGHSLRNAASSALCSDQSSDMLRDDYVRDESLDNFGTNSWTNNWSQGC